VKGLSLRFTFPSIGPGLIVCVAAALGLPALIAHGLQVGAARCAALVGSFLVLLLWQFGNFFRRNRPRV
jgi:hypothetical protein